MENMKRRKVICENIVDIYKVNLLPCQGLYNKARKLIPTKCITNLLALALDAFIKLEINRIYSEQIKSLNPVFEWK